nr:hypothetical protein [Tanacetum cinerariifolium]
PPKNCARCAKCGYLVDGPNCQGCALLRQKLKENLVTHSLDFQNTFEPSNASTNIINAPREPYVVRQDNGSFVDKISFDLNRTPDSPYKFHCFHCKDVLRDGEACKRCTCAKYGSGLGKGHCYICGHNQNSLNDSPSISETPSQSPLNIDHCCYECGDALEAAEIVILEVEEIKDDNLREKLLNVNLLIANIEALKDNPTPSFELLTKSSSTSLNSFLEETNTFHNSLLEFENFYFDLGEISSGSTTTHSDISLSEYDSFIFDLTHEEFVDELAHIIPPSEYDHFYFRDLPDPGELMFVLNSGICENLSTTLVNLPIEDNHSPLLAYVVWIFLAYLTYLVIPPYLHPFGNEDTIFDPCITINHFYSFKPGLSHRHEAFKKFNTHRSHLNEWQMITNGKNTPLLDVLLFHFYPP